MIRIILGLLTFVYSNFSAADILFIDYNMNPAEVAAARAAATQRHEKLLVYPAIKTSEKSAVLSGIQNEKAADDKVVAACADGLLTKPACQAAQQAATLIDTKASALTDKYQFGKDQLSATLKAIARDHAQISSVIISGHDGNGDFHGILGDLNAVDIKQVFAANPAIQSSVRSVFLWGCYTTTAGSLQYDWKGAFPNAEMIAGYDGMAPLGDKPASQILLRDIMVKEKELTAIYDKQKLQAAFESLKAAKLTNSSACIHRDMIAGHQGASQLSDSLQECGDYKAAAGIEDNFNCYYFARPGCEDVPSNTGKSPLRDLYNHVQSTSQCYSQYVSAGLTTPDALIVLRLIFEHQVRQNFQHLFAKELSNFDRDLDQLNAPKNLRLTDLASLSRKDFLSKWNELKNWIARKEMASNPVLNKVRQAATSIQLLADLDEEAIPFSWVEPNAKDRGGFTKFDP